MVVCLVFIGVLMGVVAALASFLAGMSLGQALGIYAFAGSVAVLLSALMLVLRLPEPLAARAACPEPDARPNG